MLTQEDDVEIHALAARGWTKAAIARHTGRDRKTISKYLARPRGEQQGAGSRAAWSRSAAIWRRGSRTIRTSTRRCCTASSSMPGSIASYPTLVRELRRLELRPVCLVCQHRRGRHRRSRSSTRPARRSSGTGWSCTETPWGEPAYVLVGALSHSSRFRAVFCEQMTFGHLADAVHHDARRRWAAPRGCGGPTGWPRSSCPAPTGSRSTRRTSPSTTAWRSRSARPGARSARAWSRRRCST